MTILHVPVAHGNWPEDGEMISDLAFESEEEALNHGEEMVEEKRAFENFFLQEVEVVESERP